MMRVPFRKRKAEARFRTPLSMEKGESNKTGGGWDTGAEGTGPAWGRGSKVCVMWMMMRVPFLCYQFLF